VGGSTASSGFNSGVFQNQAGKQTVSAASITLQGALSGNNGGAFISNSAGGGDQDVNATGMLSVKAGASGFGNRAGISTNGDQTIVAGSDISVTGGDSGLGRTSNNTSNGAFIIASNVAKSQTIQARNITLTAGSGGNDTFASITAARQTITATEDVRLNGGSNIALDGNGVRIGGLRVPETATDLTLSARDVILTGGSTAGSGSAFGGSPASTAGQTIAVNASRDFILNDGSGSGVRVGASTGVAPTPGDITINAGRDIQLNGVVQPTVIRTAADVTLTAGGSISEASNGSISARALTTSSIGSTLLGGPNRVASFNATSASASIVLANTGTLDLTGVDAHLDATIDNTGDVTIGSASATAPTVVSAGGAMSLSSTGSVVLRASDATAGAGSYLLAGGTLDVHAGSFSLIGGAADLAPAVAGGEVVNVSTLGDFTLTGGAGFLSPALLLSIGNINLTVGGTLRIDGGSGDGSFARVQTATRDGEIHITFTNAAGDYVVDGLDGRIKHGQDGFYTGLTKPAKPGDTFFVTY
jgi:hypothetical protein